MKQDESRPTILVVDDTPDNLTHISDLLKDDYRVKVACNGEKALAIARSTPHPDLILLDIMMPDMDGFEVCRRLKANLATGQIPIIFLTVCTDMADEKLGLDLGAADYITKPISPPILLARIRTQLSLKEVADFLRNKNAFLEAAVARRTGEVIEANQLNWHIITSAREGIVVHDADLRYLIWNPFMEQLTGIPADQVVGRHPRELVLFPRDAGVLAELEKALAGETLPGSEAPFTIPSTGRSGWTFNTSAPLRNAAGDIIGVIRTISDVTTHKQTEEQLRHAQKMEVVGQLAGGVAHDFNNILSVIVGYGEILRMDASLNDKQRAHLEQIVGAAQRAAQLTSGLLTFSRRQVVLPKRENLNAIVQHVQKFLARILGEDVQIRLNLSPEALPVNVDSGQIEQVIINLVTNARDAMPQGGTLTIATGWREITAPFVRARGCGEPGCYAAIEVTDSGCGMDQDTLNRIFEPFFTTKEIGKGTGLGMSIIDGIVRQHKGFIVVDSIPGQGSTFRVFLPLTTAALAALDEKPPPPPLPGRGEVILLAEDDASLRDLIVTLLGGFGYDVIMAADGQEAVEKFAAQRDRIRLVVMDMIMPRKNGAEAADEIRQLKPGTRIIFTSGHSADFIREHGFDERDMSIVAKPVQPQELLRRVRQMLDDQRAWGTMDGEACHEQSA